MEAHTTHMEVPYSPFVTQASNRRRFVVYQNANREIADSLIIFQKAAIGNALISVEDGDDKLVTRAIRK
jgi:hypothetical protein